MSLELNMDGLVGPTHNYSGLSAGNIASQSNSKDVSNPRAAALQGLAKMRALLRLGIPQGLIPPQERPYLPALRQLGFTGSDQHIVEAAWAADPILYANLTSASSMWAANAAMISPSADTRDGRVHITPANLGTMQHRAIEGATAYRFFQRAFSNTDLFSVHEPLPAGPVFTDEGAANHNRLTSRHGARGLEVFVYGQKSLGGGDSGLKYPARQTLESCEAIARRHGLSADNALFVRQSAAAINAGAFHNDVVAVANENVLLMHGQSFEDGAGAVDAVRRQCGALGFDAIILEADREQMSLQDAVSSYFFNSQLVTLPAGGMALILPMEAQENTAAKAFADHCVSGDNPIKECIYLDLRESMKNGGGPACLRLRVALTDEERQALHQPLLMTEGRLDQLEAWVEKNYRDQLSPDDLGDPALLVESQTALDELTAFLELGSFYDFQNN